MLAVAVGGAFFLPLVIVIVLGLFGVDAPTATLNLVFGIVSPVLAVLIFAGRFILGRLWLAVHRLPTDPDAVRAVSARRMKLRADHAVLRLEARRYAYRRGANRRRSYIAADMVADAYIAAGGRSVHDLFELMRAFHPHAGEMDVTLAAIAKVVGLKNIVASLRYGVDAATMVGYIERYGVKQLEDGLAAGVPFEYMEAMR
jgi:hypothetical protein